MIVLNRRITALGALPETVTGTVTLDVDSRIKSRLRVTLDDGRDAGLMLARGHLLRGGELLADADGGQVIRVLAAPETVSVAATAPVKPTTDPIDRSICPATITSSIPSAMMMT